MIFLSIIRLRFLKTSFISFKKGSKYYGICGVQKGGTKPSRFASQIWNGSQPRPYDEIRLDLTLPNRLSRWRSRSVGTCLPKPSCRHGRVCHRRASCPWTGRPVPPAARSVSRRSWWGTVSAARTMHQLCSWICACQSHHRNRLMEHLMKRGLKSCCPWTLRKNAICRYNRRPPSQWEAALLEMAAFLHA